MHALKSNIIYSAGTKELGKSSSKKSIWKMTMKKEFEKKFEKKSSTKSYGKRAMANSIIKKIDNNKKNSREMLSNCNSTWSNFFRTFIFFFIFIFFLCIFWYEKEKKNDLRKITFFVRYKWSHTNGMLHRPIKYDSIKKNFLETVTILCSRTRYAILNWTRDAFNNIFYFDDVNYETQYEQKKQPTNTRLALYLQFSKSDLLTKFDEWLSRARAILQQKGKREFFWFLLINSPACGQFPFYCL